ncbi:isoaspartyl peptidase/L-asparaginase family protein [Hymenobacter sp. B81]|uniref:isoaspartyl peptidase/L-asparaginase family protein n=1 Tax=Hymenobacter sp. B81 TaxID=3344878 RepID=UPI0037DD08E1
MKPLLLVLLLLATGYAPAQNPASRPVDPTRITLAIHGGAGTITRQNMTPEQEQAYREVLNQALQTGYAILKKGGTSLDAVEATVRVMEDSPLFNAGKGAVFTHDGRNELDAAIMDGSTLKAGSVAGVTTIRNPISAARSVMEKSEHVMMVGAGAEQFAKDQGLVLVDPSYFYTEARYQQLQKALRTSQGSVGDQLNTPTKAATPPAKVLPSGKRSKSSGGRKPQGYAEPPVFIEGRKYGTVGAVALDQYGNLAAATSTGGMTNKRYGRVGDAPLIGAGTYADNQSCAVSCTGWGEFFIRATVARDVAARVEYQQQPLTAAAQATLDKVARLGGDGGLVAVDAAGNVAMPFNTEGMYRGYIKANGQSNVLIYK